MDCSGLIDLGCDQLSGFGGIAKHLEQDTRAIVIAQDLSPSLQVSGVIVGTAVDLQTITNKEGTKLCDQLLPCV